MQTTFGNTLTKKQRLMARIIGYTTVALIALLMVGIILLLESKEEAFEAAVVPSAPLAFTNEAPSGPVAFPVGVDPVKKEILENPSVESFVEEHMVSNAAPRSERLSWFKKAVAKLALFSWYQNLASPVSRILVVEPGARKEQVVDDFGDILKWTTEERTMFEELITTTAPELGEGKFFPGNYVVGKDATPEDVAPLLLERFEEEIVARYTDDVAARVPMDDALTIASLLEREAYNFEDMRHISGVIWNRLFTDMKLQIDATLQYAKGSDPHQPWWPRVRPQDKYINSPFNTYKNEGLPPAPIANPSLDAIVAALNPRKTDCMYYFHDKDAGFHCTETYEEHVALLKQYYGRGK